ncbi:hypothetical protein BHE74_00004901 [Ensete ventricosum]|nr:hypothetical protein BHE74_00004901 [Ensete ventricosum]
MKYKKGNNDAIGIAIALNSNPKTSLLASSNADGSANRKDTTCEFSASETRVHREGYYYVKFSTEKGFVTSCHYSPLRSICRL